MPAQLFDPTRRAFLAAAALPLVAARGALAADPTRTPRQTEGPFYPSRLPLDTDNDLLILNDAATRALGEVTHLTGKVLDSDGRPVKNAVVEIWQCDHKGVYLATANGGGGRGAPADRSGDGQSDAHFQGFGRFVTSSTGEYYFRTIKPVPYPGRTPHIHVMVKRGGKELLTTQCYIKGHPSNARDGVLRGIRDERARESVQIAFAPVKGSGANEFAAHFPIVLGSTPEAG